jgi:beta-xylosidase
MKFMLSIALVGWAFNAALAAPQTIQPGAVWPDDRGQHVQAHGGGIIKVGDTYYWFGEDRGQTNNRHLRCVGCYASPDLVHWTFHNQVVKADDPAGLGRGWILERPKVYYNAPAKKYVMYTHIDDARYKVASVAIFTCDTVDGDYKYLKYFRPLDQQSRDIGQFIDDDGTAYLIFEDRPNGFHIARLSDDYLNVAREMCLIPQHLEGGAVFHLHGLYYVIGSHLTGWDANPNLYATAKSLAGPWSEFRNIAPPAVNTYGSQSTMALKVTGSQGTTVIFMGDIWKPRLQWDSRYLWMPLHIDGPTISLPPPAPWTLDVATGTAVIGQ